MDATDAAEEAKDQNHAHGNAADDDRGGPKVVKREGVDLENEICINISNFWVRLSLKECLFISELVNLTTCSSVLLAPRLVAKPLR